VGQPGGYSADIVEKDKYTQVIDVLDVWFDSSVVYNYIATKNKFNIPLNLCLEGHDQYRGWFQVSLINSISIYEKIPYKNIITHGFVLDNFGRKMSKSLNNIISPNHIVKNYGAEILRLWVSSVNYQFDVNFSDETLHRICEAYRKIRNTFRFILSNFKNIKIKIERKKKIKLSKLDVWILYKLFLLKKEITKENKKYKFYSIYKKIYKFCINELCSKYFEIIKDKLYTLNCKSRNFSQITIYIILYTLGKLIAPILSFTTEEMWGYLQYKDATSIFFSNVKINLTFINSIKFNIKENIYLEKIFKTKNDINKKIEEYKKLKSLNNNLDLNIKIKCNIYIYKIIKKIKTDTNLFFIISKINLKKNKNNQNTKIEIKNTTLKKCDRCWNRSIKKNININICKKCINNLYYNKIIKNKHEKY
jgi:isoleucyl-tRNA synthetase